MPDLALTPELEAYIRRTPPDPHTAALLAEIDRLRQTLACIRAEVRQAEDPQRPPSGLGPLTLIDQLARQALGEGR